MTRLRFLAEKDLRHSLEGEFALPVVLTSPDGERFDKAGDGRPLAGRIVYAHSETSPEGETVITPDPSLSLRRSSLIREPLSGETWGVSIPESAAGGAPMKLYVADSANAVESSCGGAVITLRLIEAEEEDGSL